MPASKIEVHCVRLGTRPGDDLGQQLLDQAVRAMQHPTFAIGQQASGTAYASRPATWLKALSVRTAGPADAAAPVLPAPGTLVRCLPTELLYDATGLDLFEAITHLPCYYLTAAEEELLRAHAGAILEAALPEGGDIVELGAGSMRKTRHLLTAAAAAGHAVTYAALDMWEAPLEEALAPLAEALRGTCVDVMGLAGTYEQGAEWLARSRAAAVATDDGVIGGGGARGRLVIWLGSSIGNSSRSEAAAFLRSLITSGALLPPRDSLLVGIDRRNSAADVQLAYNDPQGVTRAFILNALDHTNHLAAAVVDTGPASAEGNCRTRDRGAKTNGTGCTAAAANGSVKSACNGTGVSCFDRSAFDYVSWYDEARGQHEAYLASLKSQSVHLPSGGTSVIVQLQPGELIHVEHSVKYSTAEVAQLARDAGLKLARSWADASGRYDLHLFQPQG